jgi:F0F1-type ATP synthase membrane subunit a
LFAACILSFVWRTGSSTSPPSTGTFEALSPRGAVGVRIAITSVFFLGMIYFVLIMKTLRKYGTRMDQKWKQKVMEWIVEDTMAAGLTSRPTGKFVRSPTYQC